VSKFDDMVAEYEDIGRKLEKKQTDQLRARHDELARKIQAAVAKNRPAAPTVGGDAVQVEE
jgi:hypothetical protein